MAKQVIKFILYQETRLPKEVVADAPRRGRFDDYAEYLLAAYDIQVTLSDSIRYLQHVGAWEDSELQDLDTNKARLLWLACMDCKENNTHYFYMGD